MDPGAARRVHCSCNRTVSKAAGEPRRAAMRLMKKCSCRLVGSATTGRRIKWTIARPAARPPQSRKSDVTNKAWSAWASLGVIAVAAAACGLSPAPQLADGDDEIALLPLSLDLLAGDIGGPRHVDRGRAPARATSPPPGAAA